MAISDGEYCRVPLCPLALRMNHSVAGKKGSSALKLGEIPQDKRMRDSALPEQNVLGCCRDIMRLFTPPDSEHKSVRLKPFVEASLRKQQLAFELLASLIPIISPRWPISRHSCRSRWGCARTEAWARDASDLFVHGSHGVGFARTEQSGLASVPRRASRRLAAEPNARSPNRMLGSCAAYGQRCTEAGAVSYCSRTMVDYGWITRIAVEGSGILCCSCAAGERSLALCLLQLARADPTQCARIARLRKARQSRPPAHRQVAPRAHNCHHGGRAGAAGDAGERGGGPIVGAQCGDFERCPAAVKR